MRTVKKMSDKGLLIVLSGPSGVGKDTVLRHVESENEDVNVSVSLTTREMREGEINGKSYYFVERGYFERKLGEDAFLEYAEYVGNFYGTPKKYVDRAMNEGRDAVLDIEVQGALQVCAKRPGTIRIFIAPPSWEELERRLRQRGTDSEEKIQKRLLRAKTELQTADVYDYFVINDTVERAVRELDAIMLAEHCKPADRMKILSQ